MLGKKIAFFGDLSRFVDGSTVLYGCGNSVIDGWEEVMQYEATYQEKESATIDGLDVLPSKIIQIQAVHHPGDYNCGPHIQVYSLCEDGSTWIHYWSSGKSNVPTDGKYYPGHPANKKSNQEERIECLRQSMEKHLNKHDREDRSLDWNLGFNAACEFFLHEIAIYQTSEVKEST